MKHTILLSVVALATSISFAQLPGPCNAFSYNGTSDYVDYSYNPIFTPGTQGWTVSVWVKVPVASMSYSTIVSWYRCGSAPTVPTI